MKHVLHICSGFSKSRLYSELVFELANCGIKQTIYIPIRSEIEKEKNNLSFLDNVRIIYSPILSFKHRIFYFLKVAKVCSDIEKHVDLNTIDFIHAHFLFSDGGVAYNLKLKFNIPYIVAIRNTDINLFFKYLYYLRSSGIQIIRSSISLIYITPAYQDLLKKKYLTKNLTKNTINSQVIPNGLSSIWFDGTSPFYVKNLDPLKLLYVGDFSTNKNVIFLLNVIKKFSHKKQVELTLAGGGGEDHGRILKLLNRKGFNFASYIGRVEGIPAMKQLYSQHHIFIMISKLETFGLVYLEAMSQGLPVIHTARQGIDGYFKNSTFAIPVNPNSESEIFIAIEKIINNYEEASRDARKASKSFLWSNIANMYLKIYNL